MLVVIFGAGASYDSDSRRTGRNLVEQPPLADALFAGLSSVQKEAAHTYGLASPLLLQLRDCQGNSVEARLEALQAQVDTYPERAGQLMALRFYLQRVLTRTPDEWHASCQGLTNYVGLLDRLLRWSHEQSTPLALVTFNYDTLLEKALERVAGWTCDSLDAYIAHTTYRLYKPHGSVTWARPTSWPGGSRQPYMSDPDEARNAYCREVLRCGQPPAQPIQLRPDGSFTDLQMEPEQRQCFTPALAIPVERKAHLEIPDKHLEHLKTDLAQATKVLAIGWRGREDHFLRILQDHLPSEPVPLLAVGGRPGDGSETHSQLSRTGRIGQWGALDAGFTGLLQTVPGVEPAVLTLDSFLDGTGRLQPAQGGSGLPSNT